MAVGDLLFKPKQYHHQAGLDTGQKLLSSVNNWKIEQSSRPCTCLQDPKSVRQIELNTVAIRQELDFYRIDSDLSVECLTLDTRDLHSPHRRTMLKFIAPSGPRSKSSYRRMSVPVISKINLSSWQQSLHILNATIHHLQLRGSFLS